MSVLADDPAGAATADVASLRRIHLGMIDAVLSGGGLAPVAAIAAAELAGTAAILLPGAGVTEVEPRLPDARVSALASYVDDRLLGKPVTVPAGLVSEVVVRSGDEALGLVALLDAPRAADAREILELAALAALTAVTLRDASLTQRRACATLFDDLRQPVPPAAGDVVARAKRLGADLTRGAIALSTRPPSGHIDRVLAAIAQELPGALAAARDDRVEALLPVPRGGTYEAAAEAARRLARRLGPTTPVGLSPLEPEPAGLGRALRFADLALELTDRDGVDLDDLLGGSWRLLLATAAANSPELRAVLDSTVAPVVGNERDALLETLRAYLENGANMNATANAVFAHRHTVASRLERLRELTGHDPQTPAGQAQLALGLQALAVARAVG